MAIVVTEQEFLEWQENRVTKAFKKALFNDREYLKEMLLAGTDDDANVRGRAETLKLILTLDYESLMESIKESRG
jgi:hypothetical protein